MGTQTIHFRDGNQLVIGYDGEYESWFAQWFPFGDRLASSGIPSKVVGYHPDEAAATSRDRVSMEVGPYPVTSARALFVFLQEEWGLEPSGDQACIYCKKPTMDPSPDCPDHPEARLRRRDYSRP